jgi:putative zinc finger/helix-turn-helix YgiT family protein
MKCFECGADMRADSVEHTLTISGVKIHGRLPAMVCPECAEDSVEGNDLAAFELKAAHTLAQNAVRTSEVFKFMRKALGMRAVDVSELLDADPATVSRWERGHLEVPMHAFALLAELVEDRIEGRSSTQERLKKLARPPKTFPRDLEVAQPAAV